MDARLLQFLFAAADFGVRYATGLPSASHFVSLSAEVGISAVNAPRLGLQDFVCRCRLVIVCAWCQLYLAVYAGVESVVARA